MKESYTQTELDQVLGRVQKRSGWDFSRMNDSRAPVPWDYHDVVLRYLTRQATVLDIGTGGGESFLELAGFFDAGLGVDIDPEMIERARANGKRYGECGVCYLSRNSGRGVGKPRCHCQPTRAI